MAQHEQTAVANGRGSASRRIDPPSSGPVVSSGGPFKEATNAQLPIHKSVANLKQLDTILQEIGSKPLPAAIAREIFRRDESCFNAIDPYIKDGSLSRRDLVKAIAETGNKYGSWPGSDHATLEARRMLEKYGIADPDGTLAVGLGRAAATMPDITKPDLGCIQTGPALPDRQIPKLTPMHTGG